MQDSLLCSVYDIARQAGDVIMPFFNRLDVIETKSDGSPVTLADQAAHDFIVQKLTALSPEIPILSEESESHVHEQRKHWQRYWLVDPLDGTREFIQNHPSFTVNIALIEDHYPVLGVVHVPAMALTYAGRGSQGAYMSVGTESVKPIHVRQLTDTVVMASSRSHSGKNILAYEQTLRQKFDAVMIEKLGSSLKICRIAEAAVDVYPRLGPTSEWDTAAAQAVLEAAGGFIVDAQGVRLRYTKDNILNPWFYAYGDHRIAWYQL